MSSKQEYRKKRFEHDSIFIKIKGREIKPYEIFDEINGMKLTFSKPINYPNFLSKPIDFITFEYALCFIDEKTGVRKRIDIYSDEICDDDNKHNDGSLHFYLRTYKPDELSPR